MLLRPAKLWVASEFLLKKERRSNARELIPHYSSRITSSMRLFHGTENAEIQRPTVLTLGVFDGLHLGHQLIMKTVVERARAINAVPTVITFEPHPRAVLHPESAPPLLQP